MTPPAHHNLRSPKGYLSLSFANGRFVQKIFSVGIIDLAKDSNSSLFSYLSPIKKNFIIAIGLIFYTF